MQRDWPGGVSRGDGVVGVNVPALVRAGGADYAANPVGSVVQGQELTPFLLNFDLVRVAAVPAEADAPLVIDPDAPLARAVAFQRLKPVAGWNTEILQTCRRVDQLQLPPVSQIQAEIERGKLVKPLKELVERYSYKVKALNPRSNQHNIHPERLGALDHRVVEAENTLCAQACGNGKVKRVARSQLQSVVTRQLGGAAEFRPSGNGHRAMFLREFADSRRGLLS